MRQHKLRVLLIGPAYPKGGGVGMVDSIILTSPLLNENYELLHLDTGRSKIGDGKETKLSIINIYFYLKQLLKLIYILVFKQPKILHQTYNDRLAILKEASFVLICRMFGLKTIAHMHGCVLDIELRDSNPIKKALLKTALRLPHTIIVLNNYWRELLFKEVNSNIHVQVIPNCIDLDTARYVDQVNREPLLNHCNVLFMGWLCLRKGVLDTISSLDIIKEKASHIKFTFAGEIEPGEAALQIEKACKDAERTGLAFFPGYVSGIEKIHCFEKADIFILPSYAENFPLSILEAMAMGLPVISTPVAGITEMIDEGINGFLIQPGDYKTLADRILKLALDPELRKKMGNTNQQKVRENYTPDRFSHKIANLYELMIK